VAAISGKVELHIVVEGGEMRKRRRILTTEDTEVHGGERGYYMKALLNSINNMLETQLKRQNEILQQMLDIMPRPAGKFKNILETAVLFASAFSIITLIDVIIKWVIGG